MPKFSATTTGGLCLAATAILLGLFLEGGHVAQILQPTAAIIVLGGTLGAVLVQFPFPVALQAVQQLRADAPSAAEARGRMEQVLKFGLQARRSGIASLDPELKKIQDPFFHKVLMLAIDGIAAREIRDIMELESMRIEEEEERAAKVWEAAGGYAPTVGILGAVLGLIQVMQRLDDLGGVGRGIAVAFVATLYGVGLANLLFLPLAGKLRLRAREAQMLRERTLEGVLAMVEGATPRTLRERLGGRAAAPVAQMAAR